MINTFEEPVWESAPVEALHNMSTYALNVPSFTALTGAILNMIRSQFADPNNIETTALKTLIWNKNEEETKIHINIGSAKETSLSDGTPAIHITRGQCTSHTGGIIQDLTITTSDNQFSVDPNKRCVFLEGMHTITCENTTGTSSEYLAEEVWRRLIRFAKRIQDDFYLMYFLPKTIPEQQEKGDEANKKYLTTVAVHWQYMYKWQLSDEEK